MRQDDRYARLVLLIFVTIVLLPGTSLAKKPPKVYPEEGKVVGTGTLEHSPGKFSHIYKVETPTTLFALDCGKVPFMFPGTGDECGGKTKIKIGDVLHFRVEKDWAYIAIVSEVADYPNNSNHDTPEGQTEQKLRILSQQLNPDAK